MPGETEAGRGHRLLRTNLIDTWFLKGPEMKHVAASFVCAALLTAASSPAFARGSDSALDQPPAGIAPTTARLSQVLDAHAAAVGHLESSSGSVRTEVWAFTKAGAQGGERLVRRGSDYHSIITTGPFTEQYGQSGDARWYVNENGAGSSGRTCCAILTFTWITRT